MRCVGPSIEAAALAAGATRFVLKQFVPHLLQQTLTALLPA
jgi:hypothetical protein